MPLYKIDNKMTYPQKSSSWQTIRNLTENTLNLPTAFIYPSIHPSPSVTVYQSSSFEMCVKCILTVACGVVPVPGLYHQCVCPLERKEKRNESSEICPQTQGVKSLLNSVQVSLDEQSDCCPLAVCSISDTSAIDEPHMSCVHMLLAP